MGSSSNLASLGTTVAGDLIEVIFADTLCLSTDILSVVRTVEAAGDQKYSYIICAIKCYLDIHTTSAILAPLIDQLHDSPETSIVLLQNGVGIEDELMDTLVRRGLSNIVISGCAWTDSTMLNGGTTVSQHGNERLVLGYHHPRAAISFSQAQAQSALDTLTLLLRTGGVTVEQADIDVARWRKVLW